ncbi:MAG TPA: ABC transporter permease [Blastocatellia bacterium]|jgi:putative ABC transport system permease protein|nr:ABC transporter permease [Blastocatellia bacterium]
METLYQDIRYGVRTLLKNPGFSAIAVLALALGIGANTAIFSVVNAVLLRPLPFEEPDRLVMVWEKRMALGRVRNVASAPDFVDWRAQNAVFEDMAAYFNNGFNLSGDDEPERLQGVSVSPGFFSVLRAQPKIGRAFLPDEDNPASEPAAIISNGLWQRRFGGDPNIIGKTIRMNDQSRTVVGVMPADFVFPNSDVEVWVPLTFSASDLNSRGSHYLNVIARLKPGVAIKQAQDEMDRIAARLEEQYQVNTGHGVNVFSLHEEVVGNVKQALVVLLGAVGFVLLIACANVANLLLARAAVRQKEMAIRTALGAGRARIIRQLLTESTLLALAGGTLGVLLALWGLDLLLAVSTGSIPRVKEIRLDGGVLAFTFLISLGTGLIFGLVPAWQASNPDLNESLKEGGRGASAGIHRNRVRSIFVVAEVAICLVLLIGAGLMIKSFVRLLDVNPGFNAENLLTMNVSLSGSKYRETAQRMAFFNQAIERIASAPGVQGAATVLSLPMSGSSSRYFQIEGRPPQPPGQGYNANINAASGGYFKAMGIPLIQGREFNEGDVMGSLPVVIINQAMARQFWPDEDPVGQRMGVGNEPLRTVVGVVGDVRQAGLETEPRAEFFYPFFQIDQGFGTFVVRTGGDPKAVISAVRGELQAVDKDQPLFRISTMNEALAQSVAPRRLNMLLLGIFAGVALVLAAVGLYGVMSYSVTQRTREIGIRMALGAARGDVVKLVVGQGMMLASTGVALGLVASYFLTRLMSSLLYGVSATDPLTFTVISLILVGVALGASYVPARRATKVDPMEALRYE